MNWTNGSMVSGYFTRACITAPPRCVCGEQAALVDLALPGPLNTRRGEQATRGVFVRGLCSNAKCPVSISHVVKAVARCGLRRVDATYQATSPPRVAD